jgi:hypothetical protein
VATRPAAPGLKLAIAVAACAHGRCARVEADVLVEGDLVGGVRVAENVAALATVMAAGPGAEPSLAGCVVAYQRGRVGLGQNGSLVSFD